MYINNEEKKFFEIKHYPILNLILGLPLLYLSISFWSETKYLFNTTNLGHFIIYGIILFLTITVFFKTKFVHIVFNTDRSQVEIYEYKINRKSKQIINFFEITSVVLQIKDTLSKNKFYEEWILFIQTKDGRLIPINSGLNESLINNQAKIIAKLSNTQIIIPTIDTPTCPKIFV